MNMNLDQRNQMLVRRTNWERTTRSNVDKKSVASAVVRKLCLLLAMMKNKGSMLRNVPNKLWRVYDWIIPNMAMFHNTNVLEKSYVIN